MKNSHTDNDNSLHWKLLSAITGTSIIYVVNRAYVLFLPLLFDCKR